MMNSLSYNTIQFFTSVNGIIKKLEEQLGFKCSKAVQIYTIVCKNFRTYFLSAKFISSSLRAIKKQHKKQHVPTEQSCKTKASKFIQPQLILLTNRSIF